MAKPASVTLSFYRISRLFRQRFQDIKDMKVVKRKEIPCTTHVLVKTRDLNSEHASRFAPSLYNKTSDS